MQVIDPDSPIPLYYQLKTLLLEDIVGGAYPPGERLPTEHELCDIYGISRTPTRRALTELANEGVILRARPPRYDRQPPLGSPPSRWR